MPGSFNCHCVRQCHISAGCNLIFQFYKIISLVELVSNLVKAHVRKKCVFIVPSKQDMHALKIFAIFLFTLAVPRLGLVAINEKD